jgi:hypothetical protein
VAAVTRGGAPILTDGALRHEHMRLVLAFGRAGQQCATVSGRAALGTRLQAGSARIRTRAGFSLHTTWGDASVACRVVDSGRNRRLRLFIEVADRGARLDRCGRGAVRGRWAAQACGRSWPGRGAAGWPTRCWRRSCTRGGTARRGRGDIPRSGSPWPAAAPRRGALPPPSDDGADGGRSSGVGPGPMPAEQGCGLDDQAVPGWARQ